MTKRKWRGHKPETRSAPPRHGPRPGVDEPAWLWGGHGALAALANPRRRCHRLLISREAEETWRPRVTELLAERSDLSQGAEVLERQAFNRFLPAGAVHQGIAVLADPLAQPDLRRLLDGLDPAIPAGIMLLDQVSDPQNVGAVLRSASAFGAVAVIATSRNAPAETGALAKAASGALETLPFLRVANLVRAIETLQARDFQVLGLAASGEKLLHEVDLPRRCAVVVGAEGAGLRRLTRERVDRLVALPTGGPVADLNVSNAAAVALYEILGRRRRQPDSP